MPSLSMLSLPNPPFLSPSFDSTCHSSAALSTGSGASTAEKLHDGIRLLEKQRRSEVLHRHSDHLNQLSSLKDVESALSTIRAAVSVSSLLLYLLRSRGPDELQSPMQRNNKFMPLQYSLWLDYRGEDQIWKEIKATLDDYLDCETSIQCA